MLFVDSTTQKLKEGSLFSSCSQIKGARKKGSGEIGNAEARIPSNLLFMLLLEYILFIFILLHYKTSVFNYFCCFCNKGRCFVLEILKSEKDTCFPTFLHSIIFLYFILIHCLAFFFTFNNFVQINVESSNIIIPNNSFCQKIYIQLASPM